MTHPAQPPFNRHSIVPIYIQIADALLEQIRAGLLKPEDKLPSEAALVARYQASRVTVRLAIRHLVSQGVVAPRQGKGTFVLAPVIKYELGEFKGFYEQLQLQGLQPETEILRMTIDPVELPPEAVPLSGTGRHVIEFVRRYRIAAQAFAQVHTWYASHSIPDQDRLERYPVLGLVMREFGSSIKSAELGIRAVGAGPELARALEVKRNAPLLLLRRASMLNTDQLCEYSEIHIRAERYEFRMNTTGPLSVTSAIHSVREPGVPAPSTPQRD